MTQPKKIPVCLDFEAIAQLISDRKFKISTYAKQVGISQESLRKQVFAHFGTQIRSARGRNGGIQFVPQPEGETQNG